MAGKKLPREIRMISFELSVPILVLQWAFSS
jgi:hypothetical protein